MFSWFSSAGPSIIPPVFLLILSLSSLCIEHSFSWGAAVSSPLIAFALGTTFSNLRLLPSAHPLYEFAWSFVLPASLTLTLVSGLDSPTERSRAPLLSYDTFSSARRRPSSQDAKSGCFLQRKVASVGVAYVLGAVGTLAGCYVSFKVATAAPLSPPSTYIWLNKLHRWGDSSLRFFRLSNQVAAQCAACLVATYIGGCINFFTVASSVRMSAELIGGLGAADVFMMGVYSAAMLASRRLDCFLAAFPEQPPAARQHIQQSSVNICAMESADKSDVRRCVEVQSHGSLLLRPSGKNWLEEACQGVVEVSFCALWACLMLKLSSLCIVVLQWLVAMMGKTQQLWELIESSATAFLTVVTVGCTCLLRRLVASIMVASVHAAVNGDSLLEAQDAAGHEGDCRSSYSVVARVISSSLLRSKSLAKFGLIVFYGSAGCRARWEGLTGLAPAAIMFCSVTLMVHGVLLLSLVASWNLLVRVLCIRGRHHQGEQVGQEYRNLLVSFDELLVASDANVGGPSTAAAMAGGVMDRHDLVLPATIWGTVGYTVATSLGMLVYRILS
eukprot:GHVS01104087.1.p1 GENE.GHVS01104087.1~~GHVS01104087.1.p1  ORF type:complete len:557 (+),score=56.97 GHVS01104087.1:104-1774(+)